MIGEVIRNSIRFIFLLLAQGLVLNNLELGSLLNPYIYILFIIILPFETPQWALIPLGFTFGILMDAFSNTPGLHAASCVFISFLRPRMLRLFAPRDGYDFGTRPGIQALGLNWFLYYAGAMVLMHHTFFFYLEIFRFSDFFHTFFRVICSSVFTLILLVLAQFLTFRPNSR